MTQVCARETDEVVICPPDEDNKLNNEAVSSCHPSGFPQSFQTKSQVSKFVTMIVFSCSALHAAVNFSQVQLLQDV